MTWLHDRHQPKDCPDLDVLLADTWADAADAVTRLVDMHASRNALLAQHRAMAEPPDIPSDEQARLGAAVGQIDEILAAVTSHTAPGLGPAHATITAGLLTAHRSLIQLRSGLTKRTVSLDSAMVLLGSLRHALEQARRNLRGLAPDSANDRESAAISAAITAWLSQLPALTVTISRLFDDTGQSASVPIPVG